MDVQSLVLDALRHSPHVRAISNNHAISKTAIIEAAAAFDVHTFMESKFLHTNEPVGNTLTTGGPPRFLEDNWNLSAGLRKKNAWGGAVEISQRVGLQNNNSVFFLPPDQGNARLSLNFSQPLLNGAGRPYNCGLVVLANIDAGIALAQTSQELQEHLIQVNRAYWELYLQRAALLQKQRLYERARIIETELDGRQGFDSLQSQVMRARAAVSARVRGHDPGRSSHHERPGSTPRLVNAPHMMCDAHLEFIPIEPPTEQYIDVEVCDALATAVRNRPEIDQAMKHIQAANVRLNISRNELLPVLNLVLETYISGLQGSSDIGQALADQATTGAPDSRRAWYSACRWVIGLRAVSSAAFWNCSNFRSN